ncbi:MAG TPA: M14 metallopeptidase family protein [Thermoanaerobaculia bacterium]|nr:M14 metallopeptidase family protein [Thermoanaerobaculia bacterium]
MRPIMKRIAMLAVLLLVSSLSAQEIPSPSKFLGMEIGADRVLADYHQIQSYFETLDRLSPRLMIEDLGETTLGNRMIMAVISSEDNLGSLDRIRLGAAKLADPRAVSEQEIASLIASGKTVVLVTCNIHSTEIASSQMAMEWAWELATSTDPERKRWLDQVVLLLVPSLNPDGQIMVVDWYRKYLGTKYEGGPMPWLYHPYVGHDNNRDWFMLTQKETRALTKAIYHRWFPQVFVDHHQMGSTGPRMFIPPFSDPIDPDIDPLIWREIQLIGSTMAFRLEQAGKPGVIYGYSFDGYWVGGTRNTGWWKNITGLLLETASARMATPVTVYPNELSGGRKGLIDYQPQANHPNPWKGGPWRMRDIMDYQKIASNALMEVVADRREDLLRNLVHRARTATAEASPREAYLIPGRQKDGPTARKLAELMADHGVGVVESREGDFWIPLAQPYSRFVREMLETQRYPEVRVSENGEILAPYDVSAWSLPMMMGVEVEKRRMPFAVEGGPLAPPILRGDPSRPDARQPAKAPHYAISRSSPQSAKVINAALANGAPVWISAAGGDDLVQAPVPVRLAPGTAFIGEAALPAILDVAAEADVALLPVTALPEDAMTLTRPRVAIYKPWSSPSMDEGWTRFVLDGHGFDPVALDPKTLRAEGQKSGGLRRRFDVLILPDIEKEMLETGKPKEEEGEIRYQTPYPPEFAGGLGTEGAEAIRKFVEAGGTLLALDSSSNYVLSLFELPVANPLVKVKRAEFSSPGALLRVLVTENHPLTWGVSREIPVFHDDAIAFETTIPGTETERVVVAVYPDDPETILLSGWIRGEKQLARRAACVAVRQGEGRIVLYGFRPQHRAQTHVTFPLLFNAIYWSRM